MKKTAIRTAIILAHASVFLLMLSGSYGGQIVTAKAAEPIITIVPVSAAEPAGTGRDDGERFEDVIMLEGMEETVRYEHVRNDILGFEIDFDYESFVRLSEPGRECFISIYDDPENPQNYLEVTYCSEDAETASVSVSKALSDDYDVIMESYVTGREDSCIRLDASGAKNNGGKPDFMQMVYIIPAADGSRIATAHCCFESAEGFGKRFSYIVNTLAVIESQAGKHLAGTWQTASMGYGDGMSPEYYVRFADSEIIYGHMKDGEFTTDHSDKIVRLELTDAGGIRVQAEASNGVQYTYQTSESDSDVLEYFEAWTEENFPETYRGGASLSRG